MKITTTSNAIAAGVSFALLAGFWLGALMFRAWEWKGLGVVSIGLAVGIVQVLTSRREERDR